MLVKKRPRDLNQLIENKERKDPKVYKQGNLTISVFFDGQSIQSAIINYIKRQDTSFVVGCVAWVKVCLII